MDIDVSDDELDEVLFGANLSPFVKSTIYGGKDSTSMKEQMRQRFETFDPRDPTWTMEKAEMWKEFVRYKRKKEKYDNMIKLGAYANNLDAKWAFKAGSSKTAVDFVAKTYMEIPDSTVAVSDDDIRSYYNKHKAEREYKQERSRSLEYVSIAIQATEQDLASIKSKMDGMVRDFRMAKNDSAFAAAAAATPGMAKMRYVPGSMMEPFNGQILNDSIGKVIGPFADAGAMKLVKISKRVSEIDSVQARHILIQDQTQTKNLIYYLFHSETFDQIRGITQRYLTYFSPRFLFTDGDWTSLRHSVFRQGNFYLIEVIFILIGFYIIHKSSFLINLFPSE
jgi:peptidyl-prolyl cis-trans isomerase D